MKVYFIFCFLCMISSANAQQAVVEFSERGHDFGEIKEEKGRVFHTFTFINTGDVPFIINSIDVSCGCTEPEGPEAPVAPGDTSQIKVGFDPENNPGPFDKNIYIKANTNPEELILKITGIVIPRPRDPIKDYPKAIGNIRVKSSTFYMFVMKHDKVKELSFELFNHSDDTITVNNIATPNHIRAVINTAVIPPNEPVTLVIAYDAIKKNDFGPVFDTINIYTTDEKIPVKAFQVSGTIIENFDNLSKEEKDSAAELGLDKEEYDFGDLEKGKVVSVNFTLKNTGQSKLIIRKIFHTCPCTSGEPEKWELAPGESTLVTFTFNTESRSGRQSKFIKVLTNTPVNPVQNIILRAKIND